MSESFSVLAHISRSMLTKADAFVAFMVIYSYDSVDYVLPAYDEMLSLTTGGYAYKTRPMFIRNKNGQWAGVEVTSGFVQPPLFFNAVPNYAKTAQLLADIWAEKDQEPRKTVLSLESFLLWATAQGEDSQEIPAPLQRLLRDWLRDFHLIGQRLATLKPVFQAMLKRLHGNRTYDLYTSTADSSNQFHAIRATNEFIVWDLLTRETRGGMYSGCTGRALIVSDIHLVHFDIPDGKTWREATGFLEGYVQPVKLDGELEILDTCPDSIKPLNVTGGFSLLRKNAGRCYASFGHGGVDTAQFYSEDVSAAIDFMRKHEVACVAVDEATPAYAAAVALRLNIIEKTETPIKMYARFLRSQLVDHVLLTDVKELQHAVDVICI